MRLKELRIENKLTQAEVAQKLFISQNGYSGYENERTQPNIETLIKLADFYNVSIDYLVGRDNEKNPTKNYGEKKKLLKISESLTDKNFDKLIVYATALLDGQKQ